MAEDSPSLQENLNMEESNSIEPVTQVWYKFQDWNDFKDALFNRKAPPAPVLLPSLEKSQSKTQVLE